MFPIRTGDLFENVSGFRLRKRKRSFPNALYFCGLANGTYVEMGAADGRMGSNTEFFDSALGWSGVLVEPNPRNFAALKRSGRRGAMLNLAACPRGSGPLTFVQPDAGLWSGGLSLISAEVNTLSSV